MGRVDYYLAGEHELLASEGMRRAMIDAAEPVVREAQRRAPKLTGRGAASIHIEADRVGDGTWEAEVGWTRERYYLRFHEMGDRYMPARPFLVPAADPYANRRTGP